jgi:hypothetical protein
MSMFLLSFTYYRLQIQLNIVDVERRNNFILKYSNYVICNKISCSEWVSDCCLTPTQQFFSYIMARTS